MRKVILCVVSRLEVFLNKFGKLDKNQCKMETLWKVSFDKYHIQNLKKKNHWF